MDKISITGFQAVPPFAKGLVRDLRVRWAVREAGMDYDVEAIAFGDKEAPAHLGRNPFGQIPTMQVGQTSLFESGAILFALGQRSKALMPEDEAGRLTTLSWMFAALNTIEPPIQTLFAMDVLHADKARDPGLRDATVATILGRLSRLSDILADRDYLIGSFSVADILMATTLRFLRHTDIVGRFAPLADYLARCEARPAFKASLTEQLVGYEEAEARAAA